MSIKKTWFSYILWLVAAGFSILFTYFAVSNITKCFGIYGHNQIGFVIAYSAGVIGIVVLLCLLLRKLFDKICLPKWNKCLHILAFIGITGLFLCTRFIVCINSELNFEQLVVFFEMTKIGAIQEEVEAFKIVYGSLVPAFFESVYMKLLSAMFLFLGNKIELMGSIQLLFHVVSLLSLYLIGWKIQKGIFAWIPALIYA